MSLVVLVAHAGLHLFSSNKHKNHNNTNSVAIFQVYPVNGGQAGLCITGAVILQVNNNSVGQIRMVMVMTDMSLVH